MISSYKNRFWRLFLLFIILLSFSFCSNNSDNVSGADPNAEPDIDSVAVNIISGNEQIGNAGEELENLITIRITDAEDNPVQNLRVRFEIVEGTGDVSTEFGIGTTDDSGIVRTSWTIGENYNALKISPANSEINAIPQYAYASTSNPSGMARTKSLNTLKLEGTSFYSMSFYGDYSEICDAANSLYGGSSAQSAQIISERLDYYCSLFSVFGNPSEYLFGRSFDNPAGWQCLTMLGEYNPPNGYKSLAFSRMQDYGFQYGTNVLNLPDDSKERLFESAFHVPDGINEHGVVAALANVQNWNFQPDPAKESIWITYLVRKILDGARNIDEAVSIADTYNIFCGSINALNVHVLVADAEGRSVILEMYSGVMRVIPNTEQWQVITNSPSYNVSIEDQKAACSRFNNIYNSLSYSNGSITCDEGMNILQRVGWVSTEWSAMYNLTNKSITLAIDYDFTNTYNFSVNAE